MMWRKSRMNKINFGEFDSLDKVGGGVLGVFAIGGAIAEMIFSGVEPATIAGCIKDVAGTLIVVMVLIAALKRILPKHGFEEVFEMEMKNVEERYEPAIRKGKDVQTEKTVRKYIYNIAEDLNCVTTGNPKNYNTEFFSIDESACRITFKVRKRVFKGNSTDAATDELKNILTNVSERVSGRFGNTIISSCEKKDNEISFVYVKQITPEETAKKLAAVIDYVLLLYISENKK